MRLCSRQFWKKKKKVNKKGRKLCYSLSQTPLCSWAVLLYSYFFLQTEQYKCDQEVLLHCLPCLHKTGVHLPLRILATSFCIFHNRILGQVLTLPCLTNEASLPLLGEGKRVAGGKAMSKISLQNKKHTLLLSAVKASLRAQVCPCCN